MQADSRRRRAHLNLIESSRRFFGFDAGAEVEAEEGWLIAAGTPTHPVISNSVFRIDDSADAGELIARARGFFGERGRGFSVWVRGDEAEDRDLDTAATEAGLQQVYAMPEMILSHRVEAPSLPQGVELRRLTAEDAEGRDFWEIAASSYTDIGWPEENFAVYKDQNGLAGEDIVAFIAYLGEKPVSIAMTIVSHGVAGIYWVGSLAEARGKGLARAITAAATNAGFDLGADIASLQASPMGKPIYLEMGYETVFDYRLLMAPAP